MDAPPLFLGWRAPRDRNVPLQALLLLAGAALLEALGAGLPRAGIGASSGLLAGLVACGAALALGGRSSFNLATGLPFAVAQILVLALIATAAGAGTLADPLRRPGVHALLVLLAFSALAVAWKRRPYRPSRIGFLLAHVAPALLAAAAIWIGLAGPGPGSRLLLRTGWILLLTGMAWMFWLKPPLKRRERGGAA